MTLDISQALDGSFVIGDHHDESAPLVTIRFHNEADKLSGEAKHHLICEIAAELQKALNTA